MKVVIYLNTELKLPTILCIMYIIMKKVMTRSLVLLILLVHILKNDTLSLKFEYMSK